MVLHQYSMVGEMLLFRRALNLCATGGDQDATLPLVTSIYRRNIDTGYQQMLKGYADNGLLDEYFLLMLQAILSTGMFFYCLVLPRWILVPVTST